MKSSANRRRSISTLLAVGMVLAFLPMPVSATVSGDEGKIVFVSDRDGNNEIYLMNPDGTDQVNLTDHPGDDLTPNWSPDGRQIVFYSDRSPSGIWIMNGDGSDPRFLVDGSNPSYSPDGEWIAFAANFGAALSSIWIVRTDGSGLRKLTSPELDKTCLSHPASPAHACSVTNDSAPVWALDAKTIFYSRFRFGSPSVSGLSLHKVNVATGVESGLGVGVGALDSSKDFSPDGRKLIVTDGSSATQTGVVTILDLGTLVESVVGMTYFQADPSWSPTGNRLVRTHRDGLVVATDVAIQDLNSNLTILTEGSGGRNYDPAWQPLNPYPMGLVDTDSGIWHLRDATGQVKSFYYGVPGDTPFMGDWDCDGVDTPGLYRRSDGYVYLRNSNTAGFADIKFFFGIPNDVPIAGDFNGDMCDTVSLYRPSEQRFYIINKLGSADEGLGNAEFSFQFGNPGDKPFSGDFDADGIDEVALHRESTGLVYIRNTLTTGVADLAFIYGIPGDRLVANDWNGDGHDSPAVFRPANTTHYFRFENSAGFADAHYIWGDTDWLPVTGEFAN